MFFGESSVYDGQKIPQIHLNTKRKLVIQSAIDLQQIRNQTSQIGRKRGSQLPLARIRLLTPQVNPQTEGVEDDREEQRGHSVPKFALQCLAGSGGGGVGKAGGDKRGAEQEAADRRLEEHEDRVAGEVPEKGAGREQGERGGRWASIFHTTFDFVLR